MDGLKSDRDNCNKFKAKKVVPYPHNPVHRRVIHIINCSEWNSESYYSPMTIMSSNKVNVLYKMRAIYERTNNFEQKKVIQSSSIKKNVR